MPGAFVFRPPSLSWLRRERRAAATWEAWDSGNERAGYMLLKYCLCGAIIPQSESRCARCAARQQSRHTRYNEQCRSRRAAAFYVSREWKAIRPAIMQVFDNIDLWALYEEGTICTADEVHHIEELETAWEKRLDPFNLFPLSHASHNRITTLYKGGKRSMMAAQQRLLEIRTEYFKDRGGYEKVLQVAGLVAPPLTFEKNPH